MRDLARSLPLMRNAWFAGRPALEHAPPPWRDLAGEGPGAEAALAALAGAAAEIAFRPAPPATLTLRPLLPKLRLPTLAETLRPRARRLLATLKAAAAEPLLHLLAARGYSIHPADWLPGPRDEWVPDVYAPWVDWVAAETRARPPTDLSVDTYEDWPWVERRAALIDLRRRDAAAALAIVAAKAASEPAERRAKLVEILAENLSADDATFLEGLSTDRSARVKEIARHFLARLGKGVEPGALEAELAAMLDVRKTGVLARRFQLSLPKLKTAPMNARRRELFGLVSLAGLARSLGVDEMRLVESAPAGDGDAIAAFVDMATATGSDAARRALLDRLLEGRWPMAFIERFAHGLAAPERAALLAAVLARDDASFAASRFFAGAALGSVTLHALDAAPGLADLIATLRSAIGGEGGEDVGARRQAQESLFNLGCLLDAEAAQALIGRAVALGLSPADPMLDLLQFNAALKPETSP